MRRLETTVVPGTQLASGTSVTHPQFNPEGGTIHLQTAPFKEHGLDLDAYFGAKGFKRATLNLSIAPDYFRNPVWR